MEHRETTELSAVLEKDLEQALDALGVLEPLRAGQACCRFCRQTATLANLFGYYPDVEGVALVCDSPTCIRTLMDLLRTGDVKL
ncbi:MAG TPA: hypothetical protein VMH22_02655 [bacterium]|nr:hypothetical protein [bacterium]